MPTDFLFSALDGNVFSKYFDMSENELTELGMYLFDADECPCYPCRVSLIDAKIGERVLAISYKHHDENSAYRSSGPIFVREVADTIQMGINEIPEILKHHHRLLSLRGFDANHLMIEAETIQGGEIEPLLNKIFENNKVRYIHVHNAAPGCFNCSVERA